MLGGSELLEKIAKKEAELAEVKSDLAKLRKELATLEGVGVGRRSKQKQTEDKFDIHNLFMLCHDYKGRNIDNKVIDEKDMIVEYFTAKYVAQGSTKTNAKGRAERRYPSARKALSRYRSSKKIGT